MTDLPGVKLRALVNFPVAVTGRTGINVVKVNGRYYIDLDISGFVQNTNIPVDQVANKWITIWDATLNSYQNVPYSLVATAGVASLDGKTGALDIGDGLVFTGDTLEVNSAIANSAPTYDTLTDLAAATVPAWVNAVRVLGALAIGDDGDAILKVVATPGIIKPWHKPSNGAWTELMGTVGALKFFGGKSSGSTGNNSANNQALKDIAQWVTERKEASCATEMTIHPGIYDYNDSAFNLALQSATLRSIGRPILRYHGAGNALILDGLATDTPPASAGMKAFGMIGNLTVQSNTSALDAIIVRSLHDSDLYLTCGGGSASHAGLRLEFGVCSRIHYSCSGNYRDENGSGIPWWSGGVAPLYGVFATDINPPMVDITPVSFCTLYPVIEGVAYGAWLDKASGMQIMQGTIEGCTVTGLTIAEGTNQASVFGTDFEANGSQDIYIVGRSNSFFGVSCSKLTFGTNLLDASAFNRYIGGIADSISFGADTAYNQVNTNFNISGSGTLTDDGLYNSTGGTLDVGNSAYYFRPRVVVTPSASPYTYQNTTGDRLLVHINAGTVSLIQIQSRATGGFVSLSATAGEFILAPKDQIKITYSSVPTVNTWGV